MKEIKIVIILVALGVPEHIRKMLKENFPGLVNEVKFGEDKNIKLGSFLEIPWDKEMIILGNNPFKDKDYPSSEGPQDFETWINERIDEMCTDTYAYFSSFVVSSEEDFYNKNHIEEMMIIFEKFNLRKIIRANRPGPSSFIPSSATESIFVET